MAEAIQARLDRVLDHLDSQGAKAHRIVLSSDDLKELGEAQASAYRDVPIEQGTIGVSSYVEAKGAPSGDANFGI